MSRADSFFNFQNDRERDAADERTSLATQKHINSGNKSGTVAAGDKQSRHSKKTSRT